MDEVDPPTALPAPRTTLLRRALLGAAAGGGLAILVPLFVVGPYLRDDYVLDGVVRVVALDWRDFGQEKAQARLEYELDARGVGLQVREGDCVLKTEGEVRSVTCAWAVEVRVPLMEIFVPLSFRSEAALTPSGALR